MKHVVLVLAVLFGLVFASSAEAACGRQPALKAGRAVVRVAVTPVRIVKRVVTAPVRWAKTRRARRCCR